MKNSDLPAMPNSHFNRGGMVPIIDNIGGLTKREHFAAMAMQSCWHELTDSNQRQHYAYAAKSCVAMADALLEALEKAK